jgi:hypothetical protein
VACLAAADERTPVAHGRLAGDAKDSSTSRLEATNRGAAFTATGPHGKSLAAFDGLSAHLSWAARLPSVPAGPETPSALRHFQEVAAATPNQ